MGKIISPPKAPKPPPIVMIKQPDPIPVTPVVDTAKPDTSEADADAQRVQAIMARRRGLLGTVATSLRGALTDTNDLAPARKTLLGE